jgi:hypothetical protein
MLQLVRPPAREPPETRFPWAALLHPANEAATSKTANPSPTAVMKVAEKREQLSRQPRNSRPRKKDHDKNNDHPRKNAGR